MPAVAPYSSTTTAMCWFVRLNSASSAPRSFVSGTTYGGPQELLRARPSRDPAVVEGGDEIADVKDPDDLVERSRYTG